MRKKGATYPEAYQGKRGAMFHSLNDGVSKEAQNGRNFRFGSNNGMC